MKALGTHPVAKARLAHKLSQEAKDWIDCQALGQ